MTVKRLPVLFLSDVVLLPGMVVPIELDESAQAAVDAVPADNTRLVGDTAYFTDFTAGE